MDRIVHGVTKSQTQLSDFHFHFGFIPYVGNLLTLLRFKISLFIIIF